MPIVHFEETAADAAKAPRRATAQRTGARWHSGCLFFSLRPLRTATGRAGRLVPSFPELHHEPNADTRTTGAIQGSRPAHCARLTVWKAPLPTTAPPMPCANLRHARQGPSEGNSSSCKADRALLRRPGCVRSRGSPGVRHAQRSVGRFIRLQDGWVAVALTVFAQSFTHRDQITK